MIQTGFVSCSCPERDPESSQALEKSVLEPLEDHISIFWAQLRKLERIVVLLCLERLRNELFATQPPVESYLSDLDL